MTASRVDHPTAPLAFVEMTTRESKHSPTYTADTYAHISNHSSYHPLCDSSPPFATPTTILSHDPDPSPRNQANTSNSPPPTYDQFLSPFYFPPHLNGCYRYTQDLLALDSCTPTQREPLPPPHLSTIVTPLQPDAWASELQQLPDRRLVQYLLNGIKFGFRIGFNRQSTQLTSASSNMQSALLNPAPVQDFLQKETQAARVLGPFRPHQLANLHLSRFGVIPKRSQPGKWRLILDLSSPDNHSVNDGIAQDMCSLSYSSVDQAATIMAQLGRDAQLAKIDIAHAYRNVPVHPSDRHLLGMQWDNLVYIDTVLPFGLRSAPKIFSALADTTEWIFRNNNVTHVLHYLDDFFTAGATNTSECQHNLSTIIRLCAKLGFPLATDKIEGPSSQLIFLGILLDSHKMEMRLPEQKLNDLTNTVTTWLNRTVSSKRDLLSLIGLLAYATKVVPEGRPFLRRMINLASSFKHLDHPIRLNADFKSDLMWWHLFLHTWNGVSCLHTHTRHPPDLEFYTDASGTWGCGAYYHPHWLKIYWPESWRDYPITIKELLPIVLAVAIWGQQWSGKHIRCRCDNMAVVNILYSRTSKDSAIMHLVRSLHFFLAHFDIKLTASHIAGKSNDLADALSRNHMQVFYKLAPTAHKEGTTIPVILQEMLITERPDWCSQAWKQKLTALYSMA